ncbi:hypothetical protein M422DRAFT_271826 [Sphaerobolus stellatus SS14]|uniref:Uncharacterized protein n=1 Tax=Sphaerobolus stellatus (strain SS14) TaxID=990650 RepID=A0A0C9UCZ2_SPHS4|nr:hypothetical protein M422DRAFT_271826 [Sphaerobolus stellatus SS14]
MNAATVKPRRRHETKNNNLGTRSAVPSLSSDKLRHAPYPRTNHGGLILPPAHCSSVANSLFPSFYKARIGSERAAASAELNSPQSSLAKIPISDVESGAVTPRSTSGEGESRRRQLDVVDEGTCLLMTGV